jgi:hypothetical protein
MYFRPNNSWSESPADPVTDVAMRLPETNKQHSLNLLQLSAWRDFKVQSE